MATEVILPKVDPAMTEGTIIEWLKEPGSSVEKGEILFLLETEKVVLEVESPATGVLGSFLFQAAQTVSVGTVVTYILAPGEKMPTTPVEPIQDIRIPDPTSDIISDKAEDILPDKVTPVRATPLARKIARENNVDLSRMEGTGPGGRIIKQDVLKAIEAKAKKTENKDASKTVTALSTMRKTMARRLMESFQFTPHFYLSVEVTLDKLDDIRNELIPYIQRVSGVRLSYTDLLLKIVARAMEHHPEINVAWHDEGIIQKEEINQTTGKSVLTEMLQTGKSANEIIKEKGLRQVSDSDQIATMVQAVLSENPDQVAAYLGGKDGLINWFFGQVMRAAKGKANPKIVRAELARQLNAQE